MGSVETSFIGGFIWCLDMWYLVSICSAYLDSISRIVEVIDWECSVDFIDINMGCPIDIVVNKGAGSAILTKPMRIKAIIQAASGTVDTPITVKVRTGYFEGKNHIDSWVSDIGSWGASALTIHGRSRQQRYSRLADWDYVYQCTRKAPDTLQVSAGAIPRTLIGTNMSLIAPSFLLA